MGDPDWPPPDLPSPVPALGGLDEQVPCADRPPCKVLFSPYNGAVPPVRSGIAERSVILKCICM